MENLSGNIILCGDFNMTPDTGGIRSISKKLRNLITENIVQTTGNSCFSKRDERVDYIFISKNISLLNFEVLEDVVSDHKALSVEFR
jgi:endonuclease/exonuclease/phosphatase family metal-dependent hydrolase